MDFYRTFSEYEIGFGDIRAEFWMGISTSVIQLSEAIAFRYACLYYIYHIYTIHTNQILWFRLVGVEKCGSVCFVVFTTPKKGIST